MHYAILHSTGEILCQASTFSACLDEAERLKPTPRYGGVSAYYLSTWSPMDITRRAAVLRRRQGLVV